MNVTLLAAGFGAVIDSIRLDEVGPDDDLRLQSALLEHGLLVIRGQDLTPEAHVAASRLFGELESFHPAPGQIPGLPQIFRLASRSGEGHLDVGRYWHSDGSFREMPTPISIWHTVETPNGAGATLFTDLRQAWRDLPDYLQTQLASTQTLHRNGVLHPLLMSHPYTGDKGLYLNVGLTSSIVGYTSEKANELIAMLDRHLSRQSTIYQHDWLPGDVVIADNFRVAHKATVTTSEFRRVLDRTTVAAGTAYQRYLKTLAPEMVGASEEPSLR